MRKLKPELVPSPVTNAIFPATINGRTLVHGDARGEVLFSDVGLSFWGGVDAATGRIIDSHHPLCGTVLSGKVLAIPSGRGSCSGSGVLLELILNGHAPAALVFGSQEDILPLAIIIAEEVFGLSLPSVRLSSDDFHRLRSIAHLRVNGHAVAAIDPSCDVAPAALADKAVSHAGPALDEVPSARCQFVALDVAEQDTFVLVARHHQAGGRHLLDALDDRVEQGPARSAHGTGEDDVQADVAGLREQFDQGAHRIVGGRDHLVVVDDEEQVRSGPPRP